MIETKFFLAGLVLSSYVFMLQPLISKIVFTLKKRDSVKIEFNLLKIFVETLIFSVVFSMSFWVLNKFIGRGGFESIIISILVVLVKPTYDFLILPTWYLIKNKNYSINYKMSSFLDKIGFPYRVILVKDGGQNAYATGILSMNSIILISKDLHEKLLEKNMEAILCHEVGHHKKKHLTKNYIIYLIIALTIYSIFYVRGIIFSLSEFNQITNLISIAFVGGIAGAIYYYVPAKFQKKHEYEADLFAAKKVGLENYIDALKALDKISDGKVSKGGITHPTLEKRIQYLRENVNES
jgi:STE24 endopeptidase